MKAQMHPSAALPLFPSGPNIQSTPPSWDSDTSPTARADRLAIHSLGGLWLFGIRDGDPTRQEG
jgi:hypothetical protein